MLALNISREESRKRAYRIRCENERRAKRVREERQAYRSKQEAIQIEEQEKREKFETILNGGLSGDANTLVRDLGLKTNPYQELKKYIDTLI